MINVNTVRILYHCQVTAKWTNKKADLRSYNYFFLILHYDFITKVIHKIIAYIFKSLKELY